MAYNIKIGTDSAGDTLYALAADTGKTDIAAITGFKYSWPLGNRVKQLGAIGYNNASNIDTAYYLYDYSKIDGLNWATVPGKTKPFSSGTPPFYYKDKPIFAHKCSIPTPACILQSRDNPNSCYIAVKVDGTKLREYKFGRYDTYPKITATADTKVPNMATLTIETSSSTSTSYNIYSTFFIDIQAPGGNGADGYDPGWFDKDRGGAGGGGGAFCRIAADLHHDSNEWTNNVKQITVAPDATNSKVNFRARYNTGTSSPNVGLDITYGGNATAYADGVTGSAGASGVVNEVGYISSTPYIKYQKVNGGSGGDAGGDDISGFGGGSISDIKWYAPMYLDYTIETVNRAGGGGGASGDIGKTDRGCGGGGGGASFMAPGGNGAGYTNSANSNWSSEITYYGAGGGGGYIDNVIGGNGGSKDGAPGYGGIIRIYALEHPGDLAFELNTDNKSYSVTGIGSYIYNDIGIPDVYNGLPVTSISEDGFKNRSLTSVEIPDSVTSIGSHAFDNCNSLTSVLIGDSVETIGNYAFAYCDKLTSITIPANVTSIGYDAFYNSPIKHVYITDIAAWCAIKFGSTFFTYGSNLYLNDDLVTQLVIPDNVMTIGNSAFYRCHSLTSVAIPDSVTSIGINAFMYCDSLTSVVIGDSVTSIGNRAFYDCDNLTTVYYKGTAEDWNKISIESDNGSLTSATRYYYSESQPTVEGNYWRYVNGVPTHW